MELYRPYIRNKAIAAYKAALLLALDNDAISRSDRIEIAALLDQLEMYEIRRERSSNVDRIIAEQTATETSSTIDALREAINKDRSEKQQQEEDNHGEHRK